MSRVARRSIGGFVYHVLNRACGRATLFKDDHDYEAFENVLVEAHERLPTRILAYCVMPNHWHFVLWPREDGELSDFMRWLTGTHAQRWRTAQETTGMGYVYQDRFKSFPVEEDEHLLLVCRYVERNPLTANLVRRAEDWRWSSLSRRVDGSRSAMSLLARWPIRPTNLQEWLALIHQPQNEKEVATLERSMERGEPFGNSDWRNRTAKELNIERTMRSRGRPRKN